MAKKVKKVNGAITETTNYIISGKRYVAMSESNNTLYFLYDVQDKPASISHNGVIYTYIYNLQGDIVGILNSDGAIVVEYIYNAWGSLISITGSLADTLGKLNPFRYRGYVYDEEVEGTKFEELPEDWVCPLCGASKDMFKKV